MQRIFQAFASSPRVFGGQVARNATPSSMCLLHLRIWAVRIVPFPECPLSKRKPLLFNETAITAGSVGFPLFDQLSVISFGEHIQTCWGGGSANASQHAAFRCLWLQFDHVLPNSRAEQARWKMSSLPYR